MNRSCKYKSLVSVSFLFFSSSCPTFGAGELEETPIGSYAAYSSNGLPVPRTTPHKVKLPMLAVKNQGDIGTCSNHAITAVAECVYRRPLSVAEFTILAETHMSPQDGGDCKPGVLSVLKTLQVAQKWGLVDEQRLSYLTYRNYISWKNQGAIHEDSFICEWTPNPLRSYNKTMEEIRVSLRLVGIDSHDIGFRLGALYPLHHVSTNALNNAIRAIHSGRSQPRTAAGSIGTPAQANTGSVVQALSLGFPVVAALHIFSNWRNHREGVIDMPSDPKSPLGRHAVVITGFNFSKRTFTIHNSWGASWGKRGCAKLPFDYIARFATELVAVSNRPVSHLEPSYFKPISSDQQNENVDNQHHPRFRRLLRG